MSSPRRVALAGMGIYVPERIMTNKELEARLDTTGEWIQSRTGICERRIAAPEQAASDLGVIAARRALQDAGLAAEQIDLIICATASGDTTFPSTACLLQTQLGATAAGAFDISAVCSGFIYAYAAGANMIASGQAKRVLIVAAEKFTTLLDWEDRSTCVLMGDGAGAVVLTSDAKQGELLSCSLGTDSGGIENLIIPAGGSARPTTHETVDQKLHYMKMNGPEIYKFGVRIIGESVSEALKLAGLNESQLDLLIPHQANIRIIKSAAKRFNLTMDKIVVNIDRYSNTSAASVPIALAEAKEQGRLRPGMHVAMVAFGAGLTWGTVVLRW
ncbi:ketoacyl-ACP synthase III [candidate division FCPU426 bacterium]|nr:ketoacyl-ACP synthase III [candidate division FCPU426 bacterium]